VRFILISSASSVNASIILSADVVVVASLVQSIRYLNNGARSGQWVADSRVASRSAVADGSSSLVAKSVGASVSNRAERSIIVAWRSVGDGKLIAVSSKNVASGVNARVARSIAVLDGSVADSGSASIVRGTFVSIIAASSGKRDDDARSVGG